MKYHFLAALRPLPEFPAIRAEALPAGSASSPIEPKSPSDFLRAA